jgi:hypothetical protein
MLVTLLGIVMVDRAMAKKAPAPMLVTLGPSVTLVRLSLSANASSPMVMTLLGIV